MVRGCQRWIALAFGCVIAADAAAATPACSMLPNTARATFQVGDVPHSLSSNAANILVEKLLDIQLSAGATTAILTRGAVRAVPFVLTNIGNGSEAFFLEARLDGADISVEGIALDRNGNGRLDPDVDLTIASGTATPALAAGADAPLLALVRSTNASSGNAALLVTARAVTGSGTPGSAIAGQGDGGCDAVVGRSTASATATMSLTVADTIDPSQISLLKSQAVIAPDGSATPTRGATITYTIEARFGGPETVGAARLSDPVPTGTVYIPGSLRLDSAVLTDADDGDAGGFDGAGINIALSDITGPATRRVEFQVTIQ